MKHQLIIPLLALFLPFWLSAQVYVEGGRTRHRFAQTTLGIDVGYGLAGGHQNYRLDGTTISGFNGTSYSEARLIIGGLHFWGHADFYLAIPVLRDKVSPFSTGAETGANIYPFRIRNNKVVPFAGIAFTENNYQLGEGPKQRWFSAPVSAGLSYLCKAGLFDLYTAYDFSKPENYYISSSQAMPMDFPRWRAGLRYKRVFDTTLSAEKDWKNGITQRMTDTLAVMKRLNGITVGIGPSSAFFLKHPAAEPEENTSLGQHRDAPLFADAAIGYYLHQPDLQLQIAFRTLHSTCEAYGAKHTLQRTSLAAEGYKFLFDYHGFCFFAGPSFSKEWWISTTQKNGQGQERLQQEKLQPGIVFGWDIRPNRLQSLYLRTHLRWYPGMKFNSGNGNKIPMDQLEFNYIQLVVFPGRMF